MEQDTYTIILGYSNVVPGLESFFPLSLYFGVCFRGVFYCYYYFINILEAATLTKTLSVVPKKDSNFYSSYYIFWSKSTCTFTQGLDLWHFMHV